MLCRIVGMVAILAFATGCQGLVESFVRLPLPNTDTAVPFEGQQQMKISPGSTISAAADVSMEAHVTVTDRDVSASDVSARMSLGRSRSPGR